MVLTPIDVQQKTFATALRGYDLDEVDDFLDGVVIALKDYDQRLRDAQERISTLEAELADSGDNEGVIARALVAAQRSADSLVADAKVESETILAEARSESVELEAERSAKQEELRNEVTGIQDKITSLRTGVAELAGLIPAQLDAMDELAAGAADSSGATFDAALPASDYSLSGGGFGFDEDEIPESPGEVEADAEEDDVSSSEVEVSDDDDSDSSGLTDDSDVQDDDPEGRHEVIEIDDLSERIDAAFDDSLDADEISDGSARPWET